MKWRWNVNAPVDVIAEIPAPDTAEALTEPEAEAASAARVSRSASMSDAEWIVMTAGIVLAAAAMAVLGGMKRKGGKAA